MTARRGQAALRPTGAETANILTTPANLSSKNTKAVFDIDAANKLLDEAGYKRGGDGIRMTPDGVRMKVVFQTSINSLRQKEQAIAKDGWQKIGIETELKSVDAGVFFSSDPGNPDTYAHFSVDTKMFTSTFDSPFPVNYMKRFSPAAIRAGPGARSQTTGPGPTSRSGRMTQYDTLFDQVLVELNPTRRPRCGSSSTIWSSTITRTPRW